MALRRLSAGGAAAITRGVFGIANDIFWVSRPLYHSVPQERRDPRAGNKDRALSEEG